MSPAKGARESSTRPLIGSHVGGSLDDVLVRVPAEEITQYMSLACAAEQIAKYVLASKNSIKKQGTLAVVLRHVFGSTQSDLHTKAMLWYLERYGQALRISLTCIIGRVETAVC